MNVATYISKFLKSKGVPRVFGLPGGEVVLLIDALGKAGIAFELVHHEAAAGFAADVTGQLTGRPGVCLSTVGPGALNLLSGVASANLERSPVVAITGEIDQSIRSTVAHMNIDLGQLFSCLSKGSFSLRPESVREDLETAWRLALGPPPGAVHISLSQEVAAMAVPAAGQADFGPAGGQELHELLGLGSLDNGYAKSRNLIRAAVAPFVLAGLGVEAAGAQSELTRLAEAWNVPVAVTPKAKGHFPEDHPLFAGCVSAYADVPLRKALIESDLIVGIGLDGVDLVTSRWEVETPLINFAPAAAADPVFRPLIAVEGDLKQMLKELRRWREADKNGQGRATRIRQGISEALKTSYEPEQGAMSVNGLITAMQQALPSEAIVTLDVGAFKLVFLQQWQARRPKSLFVANGLSAMGYALPGAIAAKLAEPHRPVVAILGDGALLMYAGELATLARQSGPVAVVVIVDQSLALIRLKQVRQGFDVLGTEFTRTDYRALATAFGLGYRLIDGANDVVTLLKDTLASPRSLLVEVRVDRREYELYR